MRGREGSSASASASWGMALGTDEAGRLDLAEPGVDQQLDEPALRRGGDGRGLVLQAVARPDLVDPDVVARHRWTSRGRASDQPFGGSIARSWRAISTSMRATSADACSHS